MSIDQETLNELETQVKEFQVKRGWMRRVSEFPSVGQHIEINGLRFRVTATNQGIGRLRLELEQP